MHVVFVAWRDLANPQAGGSEVLVDQLATGLLDRGHRVGLIAGGPIDSRPYPVVENGGTFTQYLTAGRRQHRWFADADLVVDVSNGIPFFGPIWRRGPLLGIVHHLHTDQWPQHFPPPVAAAGSFVERRIVPPLYRKVPIAVSSPSTLDDLVGLGFAARNLHLLPIGIDVEPAVAPQEAGEPCFVAIGRLVPHKRIDLLLDLWERVRPTVGGRLIVVGDGPDRGELQSRRVAGVEFTGYVSDEERREILESAWLLVHPAHHEGWGIVIMEAAAVGTPSIGFDVPGVRDAIANGVSGVVAGSEDDFVSAWVELAADGQRRRALGEGAHRRALEYTWDRTVDVFEKLAEATVEASS